MMRYLVLLLALLLSAPAWACKHNSLTRAHFQSAHPCPSTGHKTGACPGWVVDHIKPLCAGGRDATYNMQWQDTVAAKLKDAEERKLCANLQSKK